MSKFQINANTYNLNGILNKELVIPVYQRPYEWEEKQVRRLMQDILKIQKRDSEDLFIGTMQLTLGKGKQEIIDGQQRLTTLMILSKVLGHEKVLKIKTNVNNGTQNELLESFMNMSCEEIKRIYKNKESKKIIEEEKNRYLKNAFYILEILDECECEREELKGSIEKKIIFVVIETRATLTETLKIFDTINSTGLDLNGADLFKIKFYEYIKEVNKAKECPFEKISKLYESVDRSNKDLNTTIEFGEILKIYQTIIISENNMSNALYSQGTDTFFENLFNSLLKVESKEGFKNLENIVLNIEDIEKIIELRFQWEKEEWNSYNVMLDMNFIWWSRYSRYWHIIFLMSYADKEYEIDKILDYLSKIFIVYSINYAKGINQIHGLLHKIYKEILSKKEGKESSSDNIIKLLSEKLEKNDWTSGVRNEFERNISGNIFDTRKKKDILCRISALTYEDKEQGLDKLEEKIFSWREIDIEHIHSRSRTDEKWDEYLNSIGNLMMLERDINRSIKDIEYGEKIDREKGYRKSELGVVKYQVANYKNWDLELAKARRDKEVKKIMEYVFKKS